MADDLSVVIAAKNETIKAQRETIEALRRRLAIAEKDRDARYTEAQVRNAVATALLERR